MKQIELTHGKFALVDDEDYELVSKYLWNADISSSTIYAQSGTIEKGYTFKMHRFIMGCKKNDGVVIDHIDHNGLNNQKSNLRIVTQKQNAKNKTSSKNSLSKYLGVSINKSKSRGKIFVYWIASINVDGMKKTIGRFPFTELGEKQAALAYNEWAIKYHKEFANLNKINESVEPLKIKKYSSEFRGVRKTKTGMFSAYIKKGKYIHLGTFKKEEDAAFTYNEAAKKYFGDEAILNVISNNNNFVVSSKTVLYKNYRGVSFIKSRNYFRASLSVNKKRYYVFNLKTEKDAALAYNELAKKHFGEKAKLNII